MMESDIKDVVDQLRRWFEDISRLTGETLFASVPEGPHREAVVLDVLKRNARALVEGELDAEGKLYSPLCLFLAAACRMLRISLGLGHWRAAMDNFLRLRLQVASAKAKSEMVNLGLDLGSPAQVFKQQLDESVKQAGLAGGSYLDKENRQVALGLAINWGMRLLLAYSLECDRPAVGSERRDLAWIRGLIDPLVHPAAPMPR